MDFLGDILKVFFIIGIPIILKSLKDKKEINAKKNIKQRKKVNTINKKRIEKAENTVTFNVEDEKTNKPSEYMETNLEKGIDKIKDEGNIDCTIEDKNRHKKEDVKKDEIRDEIRENEIGIGNVKLSFKEDEIIKGILMAEILKKPKGLE
ncbi:hypothetical protein [Thermohalobacter berrensis]|uniref:Uncharacterized protein n=1 Tax=Thermohalobacter berrensis TaxID=99594 RepID=A0A419TB60_9FIRM|nr:hypothetical protein [Thermohalobacter berrensis]RKD34734.1 hypothetical protein BET03_02625 [Thermohalobacter berrensis]